MAGIKRPIRPRSRKERTPGRYGPAKTRHAAETRNSRGPTRPPEEQTRNEQAESFMARQTTDLELEQFRAKQTGGCHGPRFEPTTSVSSGQDAREPTAGQDDDRKADAIADSPGSVHKARAFGILPGGARQPHPTRHPRPWQRANRRTSEMGSKPAHSCYGEDVPREHLTGLRQRQRRLRWQERARRPTMRRRKRAAFRFRRGYKAKNAPTVGDRRTDRITLGPATAAIPQLPRGQQRPPSPCSCGETQTLTKLAGCGKS